MLKYPIMLSVIIILFTMNLYGEFHNPFEPRDTIVIMAVGDIMFDRNVEVFQKNRYFDYPFHAIYRTLDNADFLTGNLESMISNKGEKMNKKYCFCADSNQIDLLKSAGFDCMTVGNNHSFDYTTKAFLDCMDVLKANGIASVGGGKNIGEARKARFFNIDGLIIGLLGFNDTKTNFIGHDKPSTVPTWGPSWVLSSCLDDIIDAKEQCDLLLVHIHWGDEDTTMPNNRQQLVGHCMIEAGADVILGHHPHRLQSVEFYQGDWHSGIIAYSLGNFIFDQNDYLNNLSGILQLKIVDYKIESIEMIPIEMKSTPRATSPACGEYANDVYNVMKQNCEPIGTNVILDTDTLLVFTPNKE